MPVSCKSHLKATTRASSVWGEIRRTLGSLWLPWEANWNSTNIHLWTMSWTDYQSLWWLSLPSCEVSIFDMWVSNDITGHATNNFWRSLEGVKVTAPRLGNPGVAKSLNLDGSFGYIKARWWFPKTSIWYIVDAKAHCGQCPRRCGSFISRGRRIQELETQQVELKNVFQRLLKRTKVTRVWPTTRRQYID